MIIDKNDLMPLSFSLVENEIFQHWAIDVFKGITNEPSHMFDELADMIVKSEIACAISKERERLYMKKRMNIVALKRQIKNIQKNEHMTVYEKKYKAEDLREEIKGIKNEIEQSAVQGFDNFEDIFDQCFSENHLILRSVCLTKKTDGFFYRTFINYHFGVIKQAKDFSVLYFAYWLFDLYCKDNPYMLSSEKRIMAQKIAYDAYKILVNKDFSKYSMERLLLSFFSWHLDQDSMHLYLSCLIEYIQAVYHSKVLAEEERCEIFQLFGLSIICINNLLAIPNGNDSPIFDNTPLELEKKVAIKKIDNSLYQWRSKEDANKDVVELFAELKADLSKMLKDYPKTPRCSEKICRRNCGGILLKIFKIWDMCDESEAEVIFNMLRCYYHIFLRTDEGKKINFGIFVIQNACFHIAKDPISTKDMMTKYSGNIYLDMLTISPINEEKALLYKRILSLIKSTMEQSTCPIDLNESRDDAEKGITDHINLDFLKLPILTFDTHKYENTIILQRMLNMLAC